MNKKVVILGILTVLLSITIAIGFSYAVWTQTKEQDVANTFSVGCFDIQISNEENTINLDNDYPITDETGKTRVPFTFTVTNTCDYYGNYAVNLEKLTGSDLGNQYIKVMLNNKRPQLYDYYNIASKEDINSVDSRTLTTDGLNAGESKEYSLRIWLDESGTNETVGGKKFNSKIVISAVATYQSGAEYIASLLTSNPETMKNDDPDENVRYIGASPNNYVTFNNEQWRIIGVFDMFECTDDATVENYTSKCSTKKLLKIINNERIGVYSWDSSESKINNGWGVNEWSKAKLNILLNNYYYNNESGHTCYNGKNSSSISCDFDTNGIKKESRTMIANALWSIGTVDGKIKIAYNNNAKEMYIAERSDNNGKICTSGTECNDQIDRTTKWVGKIGLMYPSDYGYATSGDSATNRDICLQRVLYKWNDSSVSGCKNNDWLYNSKRTVWTMTPEPWQTDGSHIFNVTYIGTVDIDLAPSGYSIYPVVYLKSDVKIIHDDNHIGSEEKPYELIF